MRPGEVYPFAPTPSITTEKTTEVEEDYGSSKGSTLLQPLPPKKEKDFVVIPTKSIYEVVPTYSFL